MAIRNQRTVYLFDLRGDAIIDISKKPVDNTPKVVYKIDLLELLGWAIAARASPREVLWVQRTTCHHIWDGAQSS